MEKPDTGKDLAQGELERARQRAAELEAALAACLQGAFSFSVLESIPSPIFVKDEEFRLVYVNRAVGELGGFPPEYLLGKSDYEYLCPEEADAARKRETCARRGVDVMVEDKWENVDEIRKSATVLCFLSRANALFEAENVVRVDNFSGLHRQIQRIGQSRAGGGKTGGDLPCGESA